MTPERLAVVTANLPSLATFTRLGPIVTVTNVPGPSPTYELKMFLDNLTDLNARLGPNPNDQPAPEPVRHYEIWCEDVLLVSVPY